MKNVNLEELVPLLEEKLGIEPGFFKSLDDDGESDWAFIIKLHALIEAAVSYLLTTQLATESLSDVFARLELSNTATGKLAFAKALKLLDEAERRFVRSFSELRNDLVHDIRNVKFELHEYVAKKSASELQTFQKRFNLETTPSKGMNDLLHRDPRQALWYQAMAFLGSVYLRVNESSPKS